MPATYEPIATTTLGTAASTITFSSIPATYTDLRLVFIGYPTSDDGLAFQVNGLSTTIYSGTAISGSGTTASSTRVTDQTYGYLTLFGSASATIPTLYTLDVMSYAGSTNKTVLSTASTDKNGSGTAERIVHLCRTTSALTSITLLSQNAYNLKAGSTATLYGIKKA
jgi:hypothetical protein